MSKKQKQAGKKEIGKKPTSKSSPRTGRSTLSKLTGIRPVTEPEQIEVQAKAGRPSKFDKDFIRQAEKLCELEATDEEVAIFLEVDVRTVYRWKLEDQAFCQALKRGKEVADERVERSLYARAVGYTFDSEKIFQFQGEVVRANTKEHVPPDTTAMIFWLKNRRPSDWRDKQELEVTQRKTRVIRPSFDGQ